MRVIQQVSDLARHTPGVGEGAEVTPAMIWAALEEWSGFDEARDDLDRFVVRLWRAMEAARRRSQAA